MTRRVISRLSSSQMMRWASMESAPPATFLIRRRPLFKYRYRQTAYPKSTRCRGLRCGLHSFFLSFDEPSRFCALHLGARYAFRFDKARYAPRHSRHHAISLSSLDHHEQQPAFTSNIQVFPFALPFICFYWRLLQAFLACAAFISLLASSIF